MGDELVISPTPEQLEQFLGQMLLPSNETLQQTTKFFKKYIKLSSSVIELLERVRASPNPSIRQLASVYLRKCVLPQWKHLDANQQTIVKTQLLEALCVEPEPLVKRNIANVVVSVADVALAEWPQVLELINQLASSEEVIQKELGLYILSEMLENKAICELLAPHLDNLRNLFLTRLNDATSIDVRKLALKAIGNLVMNYPNDLGGFDMPGLLPHITQILEHCIQTKDETTVCFGMDVFTSLIKIDDLIPVLIKFAVDYVMVNTTLETNTRACAADFVDDVIIGRTKFVAKQVDMLSYVITKAMEVACEDESQFDRTEDTPVDVAMRLLDALSNELSNKVVFAPLMNAIGAFRNDAVGQKRKAAVLALGVISEGCAEPMKKRLPEIVPNLILAFDDPEKCVKEAAGLTIGYCAQYLLPQITDYHQQILPALIIALDQYTGKVKQKVLYAIDTFCENCEEEVLGYLETLIPKLVASSMQGDDSQIKAMAVSALTSIVCAAESSIRPYFDQLAQFLYQIVVNETDVALKAHALQCIGQLAGSVGVDQFLPYVEGTANIAVEALRIDQSDLREAAFAYFYAVAGILKQQYETYADFVISEALKSCEREEPEDESSDSDSDSEDEAMQVRTALLDEKTAAIHALGSTTSACPNKFLQHSQDILNTLEVNWGYYHGNVRTQVVSTYQLIIESLFETGQDAMSVWTTHVEGKMLKAMEKEYDKAVVIRVLEASQELLKTIGAPLFTANLAPLCDRLETLLDEKAKCQRDVDEEDRDYDEKLLCALVDLVSEVSKTYQGTFVRFAPKMTKFLNPQRSVGDRTLFIGCYADCLKANTDLVPTMAEQLLPLAFNCINDEDETLYRNTVYCIGILCEFSGAVLAPRYMEILACINKVLQTPEIDPATIDNAISAVGRMILANAGSLPLDQVLPTWFAHLPLKSDWEEAQTIVRTLILLFKTAVPLGAYTELAVKLLFDAILTQTKDPDKYKLQPELVALSAEVLKGMQGDSVFQSVGAQITPEEQTVIQGYLA